MDFDRSKALWTLRSDFMSFFLRALINPYMNLFQPLTFVIKSDNNWDILPKKFYLSLTNEGRFACFVHLAINLKGFPKDKQNARLVLIKMGLWSNLIRGKWNTRHWGKVEIQESFDKARSNLLKVPSLPRKERPDVTKVLQITRI